MMLWIFAGVLVVGLAVTVVRLRRTLAELLRAAEACAGAMGLVPPWVLGAIMAARKALGLPVQKGPMEFFEVPAKPPPPGTWSNR